MVKCSVGVIVYNEEKNIAGLLKHLLKTKTNDFHLNEIIVVSDGSTDTTNKIVKEFSREDERIKLLTYENRKGKAYAVNMFLKNAQGDICILSSGDIAITGATIQNLCNPLIKELNIGMTGCNPIPLNNAGNFLGYLVHFWWFAHNRLPRFGEMIAFRNVITEIDNTTSVDEAFIERRISKIGLKLKHIPSAIVYNRGAANLKDLLRQRKRINIGHIYLKKIQGYSVSSFNLRKIFELVIEYWARDSSLKHLIWLLGGALIEIYSRISSIVGIYFLKDDPFIWEIAASTKDEIEITDYDPV